MATTRKTMRAARITGSRGRPRHPLPLRPLPPLFGILILMATFWTRHLPKKLPAGQTMGRAQRFDLPANSLCRLTTRSFQSCSVSGGDDFHCTAALVNKKKPAVHAGLKAV